MDELLKKIEIYNIINYLLPGVIFGAFFNFLVGVALYDSNVAVAVVEYYFTGLVLSRIGSVVVKPILKFYNLIYENDYKDFIDREKDDEKIKLLVREGNQYRTFIATFVILTLIELYNVIQGNKEKSMIIILFAGLIILFIFSYRKQTKFISKRVENK